MNAFAIKRIPNVEHTQRVLDTRRALRVVPPSEGVWLSDSGSDAERGDAFAAPSEGSQSGGEAASPNPCSLIEKDSRRGG